MLTDTPDADSRCHQILPHHTSNPRYALPQGPLPASYEIPVMPLDAKDGFMHFSTPAQVSSADRHSGTSLGAFGRDFGADSFSLSSLELLIASSPTRRRSLSLSAIMVGSPGSRWSSGNSQAAEVVSSLAILSGLDHLLGVPLLISRALSLPSSVCSTRRREYRSGKGARSRGPRRGREGHMGCSAESSAAGGLVGHVGGIDAKVLASLDLPCVRG